MRYLIVVEPTDTGYSAYSPDLPGCVSTGRTREEIERNMREAIAFHFDGMREDGDQAPPPASYSTYVEVPAQPLARKTTRGRKAAGERGGDLLRRHTAPKFFAHCV